MQGPRPVLLIISPGATPGTTVLHPGERGNALGFDQVNVWSNIRPAKRSTVVVGKCLEGHTGLKTWWNPG